MQPRRALLTAALVLVLSLVLTSPASAQSPVPANATVEKIAEGFQFTEGPYWHSDGFLLFSDIPANTIYQWNDGGATQVYRRPSGHSNGITADTQGRLILAQHGWHSVSRVQENGQEEVLAEHYQGQRLNSPNDVAVADDGAIYFTDPPYGVESEDQELDFAGIYRISPDGKLTLLTKEFVRPNGIVLSPDEQHLYVNDTRRGHIRVYDLTDEGTLSNGRILAELKDPDAQGGPDGMTIDQQGNVYSTGPGGVWIVSPEGEVLDRISVPDRTTNITFGGPDHQTLYITAGPALYRIRVNASGAR